MSEQQQKRPAHRPVSVDAQRHTVTLDRETVRLARELGGGNLSAGLRYAVTQTSHLGDALRALRDERRADLDRWSEANIDPWYEERGS